MDAPYCNGIDPREFGPEHDPCSECGADLIDDAHDRTCSRSDDYFEPDWADVECE